MPMPMLVTRSVYNRSSSTAVLFYLFRFHVDVIQLERLSRWNNFDWSGEKLRPSAQAIFYTYFHLNSSWGQREGHVNKTKQMLPSTLPLCVSPSPSNHANSPRCCCCLWMFVFVLQMAEGDQDTIALLAKLLEIDEMRQVGVTAPFFTPLTL